MIWLFSCHMAKNIMGLYRNSSISIKFAIFVSINIFGLIVFLILLIIVTHTKLYIDIHTLVEYHVFENTIPIIYIYI